MQSPPLSPFDHAINRIPIQFAMPVFFGESPAAAYSAVHASGTGAIVRLHNRFVGVTCQHVLAAYRKRRAIVPSTVFQFGHAECDPEGLLIAENAELDLATLDLTSFVGNARAVEPRYCIDPAQWPPAPITKADIIAFAGFPGIWREEVRTGHLRFFSFSSGAGPVHSIGDKHLITRIQFNECVVAIRTGRVLGSLGGLSGGPVFVWRTTPVMFAELIGFAMEYQDTLDLLYVRLASAIDNNGRILN